MDRIAKWFLVLLTVGACNRAERSPARQPKAIERPADLPATDGAIVEALADPDPTTRRNESVRPGINRQFLGDDLNVARWKQTFERESREVFTQRKHIMNALALRPGMRVADVGAGTGLFLWMMAGEVGPEGTVIGVDISPRFLAELRAEATRRGLSQVRIVEATERSSELPLEDLHLVFICDTYHHFEYPEETLESIHRAMAPGGRLVIIDFEIGPKTKAWIRDHVRGDKDTFRGEVESAGFAFVEEVKMAGMRENYMLLFERI